MISEMKTEDLLRFIRLSLDELKGRHINVSEDLRRAYRQMSEGNDILLHDYYDGEPPELAGVQVCSKVAQAQNPDGSPYPNLENQGVWRHGGPYPETEEGWRNRVIWDYVISRITGDTWAEFGVAQGNSAHFFLRHLPENGKMYMLDSFEGLPEEWNQNPVGTFACKVPEFNDPRAIVIKGWFEDTISQVTDVLDFVHIDSDIYSAAKTVLDNIKVRKGTIILFDELWGWANGTLVENADWRNSEYKALIEWDRPYKFIVRDTQGRAAIEVLE